MLHPCNWRTILEEQNRVLEEIKRPEEFDQEKELLKEERRKFSEAAMKLGLERAAFQKEKEDFEGRKRRVEAPGTPLWLNEYMTMHPNLDSSALDELMKSPKKGNPFVEKENMTPIK